MPRQHTYGIPSARVLQGIAECSRGFETNLRLFHQGIVNHLGELGRNARATLADWDGVGLQKHLPVVRSLFEIARVAQREHVIKGSRHGPDIDLRPGVAVVDQLLAGHETGRAADLTAHRQAAQTGEVKSLGQSVIADLGEIALALVLFCQQDIVGLDVAMDEAARGANRPSASCTDGSSAW